MSYSLSYLVCKRTTFRREHLLAGTYFHLIILLTEETLLSYQSTLLATTGRLLLLLVFGKPLLQHCRNGQDTLVIDAMGL